MAMTSTVLQEIRTNYPSKLDKYETRGSNYGLLTLGIDNATSPAGIITSDVISAAKNAWGQDVKIPVMSPIAHANGTGLGCTVAVTESNSALASVTFVTISNGFAMQPQKSDQNEINYINEFARKYTDASRKMALEMDVAVDTALIAALTPAAQYNSTYVGAATKYGPLAANYIQVSLANRGDFFNDLTDIFAADDLYPMFDVIGSTNLRGIVSKLYAQGEANSANTQYQFTQGDFDFKFSNRVTVNGAASASLFAMPKGAYAIVTRNSYDCQAGRKTTDGKVYDVAFNEVIGADVDTLYYSTCADISALSGNALDTAQVQEYHQMAVHFAIIVPYTNFATSGVPAVIRGADILAV